MAFNKVSKFLFRYLIRSSLHFHPFLKAAERAIRPVMLASSAIPYAFCLKAFLRSSQGITAKAQFKPGTLNVLDAE